MGNRVVIDPLTRIEGHLRVDVEVAEGRVAEAWASCTMWRGIEKILRGRDPRDAWAFAQRFCGVCPTVHAMASVRAVEDALGIWVPPNAQYIRNLTLIAHALHDHIVHFYHLSALDWVDVTTIPDADPAEAAKLASQLSPWHRNAPEEMAAVKRKVTGMLNSPQPGLFAHGYWGHQEMKLPPHVNLLAVSHYLQALEYQRKANQMVAMLGGKTPHVQNLVVGGVANAINPDSQAAMNVDRLYRMKSLLDEVAAFVHQVYLPDVCAIAALYSDWFEHGQGVDTLLAVPDLPRGAQADAFELPGGVLRRQEGGLGTPRVIADWKDATLRAEITEDVSHAWYQGDAPLHPYKGETEPAHAPFDPKGKYTWVKAPRYEGRPAEVGPLADVLVGYAQGHPLTKTWLDRALQTVSSIAGKPIPVHAMWSTMGRYVARGVRAAMLAELAVSHWQRLTDNVLGGDGRVHTPVNFPKGRIEGVGFHAAPRGLLSHWVVVEDGQLANYQAVVPTTWNAGPRDAQGVPGPYEASLVGVPVADAERPLEVLRTIHAFDPCMACACHTYDAAGTEVATVKVL